MKRNLIICLCLAVLSMKLPGQQIPLDSLKKYLSESKNDSVTCNILCVLSEAAPEGEWETFNRQLGILAEKKLAEPSLSTTHRKYYEYYRAVSLNNNGIILYNLGNIAQALDHYQKSLYLYEKIGEKQSAAEVLNNIGIILMYQEQYDKALEYYLRCLNLTREINPERDITPFLNNVGFLYQKKGNISKSLEYYEESLKLSERSGNAKGMALSYNNIGLIYKGNKNLSLAAEFYDRSIEKWKETGDKSGLAYPLGNLAEVYLLQKEYDRAYNLAKQSYELGKELGFPQIISNAAGTLCDVYSAKGDYKKALIAYQTKITMRDSIINQKNRKASITKQVQYAFDKKAAADSVKNAEQMVQAGIRHEEAIKQQKMYTYGGGIGFGFMMVIAGISFRAYRNKRKANFIISKQKLLVEEQKINIEQKQNEIMDSIYYARRIQQAFLTHDKYICKTLSRLNSCN